MIVLNIVDKPTIKDYFLAVAPYINPGADLMNCAVQALCGTAETENKVVDERNGFMEFDFGRNEDARHVETCYWRMKNGKALVAVYYFLPPEDVFCKFFVVDPATKTFKAIPEPFEVDFDYYSLSLPRQGKTIIAKGYNGYGEPIVFKATFNGETFTIEK